MLNYNIFINSFNSRQSCIKIPKNRTKNNKNNINNTAEALLFLSSRSQLVSEVIMPKIKDNIFILCDRYTDSTLAYQGYGRGLDKSQINILNQFATFNIKPDITFILDLSIFLTPLIVIPFSLNKNLINLMMFICFSE